MSVWPIHCVQARPNCALLFVAASKVSSRFRVTNNAAVGNQFYRVHKP
jgi:hypothetical protein